MWIVSADIRFPGLFNAVEKLEHLSISCGIRFLRFRWCFFTATGYGIFLSVSVDFPIVSCGFPTFSCWIRWSSDSFTISGTGWKNTFPGTVIFRCGILRQSSYVFPAGSCGNMCGSCRKDAGKALFPAGSGRKRMPEPLSWVLETILIWVSAS